MEAKIETAPSGMPATPRPSAAILARGAAELAPTDGAYLDLALDADAELLAAARGAAEAAAASERLVAVQAPARREIPELPRVSVSPAPFLPQLWLLTGVTLLVGAIAVAAARPPAPGPSVQAAPLVVPARDPSLARLPALAPAPARRAPSRRARPVVAVEAPGEIGAPAPELRAAPLAAPPAPVSAPVLERPDDQSISVPPLTGT